MEYFKTKLTVDMLEEMFVKMKGLEILKLEKISINLNIY